MVVPQPSTSRTKTRNPHKSKARRPPPPPATSLSNQLKTKQLTRSLHFRPKQALGDDSYQGNLEDPKEVLRVHNPHVMPLDYTSVDAALDFDEHLNPIIKEEPSPPPKVADPLEGPHCKDSRDDYHFAKPPSPTEADSAIIVHPLYHPDASPTSLSRAPPPISTLDIFGDDLTRGLSDEDVHRLKKEGIDIDRAAEAWSVLQMRELRRRYVTRVDEERSGTRMIDIFNPIASIASTVLSWKMTYTPSTTFALKRKQHPAYQDRIRKEKFRLIRIEVGSIERKLQLAYERYTRQWDVISSRKIHFPLLDFRDIPWPIQNIYAISPKQLSDPIEIWRFLFASCVNSSKDRRARFKEAMERWDRKEWEKKILPWAPERDEVLEGVSQVQGALEKLERVLEPGLAKERREKKRRLEEDEASPPMKKRKVFGDVWNKVTNMFAITSSSFNFNE